MAVFVLKKFYQFRYGRHYILVTDHKPLLLLFGPGKETPLLVANHLARWELTLSQYDYSMEFRKTRKHGNANALSHLPAGGDLQFDGEEMGEDVDNVCTVCIISRQIVQDDPQAACQGSKQRSSPHSSHALREGRLTKPMFG